MQQCGPDDTTGTPSSLPPMARRLLLGRATHGAGPPITMRDRRNARGAEIMKRFISPAGAVLVLALFAVCLATPPDSLLAQATGGDLNGRVVDGSQATLP